MGKNKKKFGILLQGRKKLTEHNELLCFYLLLVYRFFA